MQSSINTNQPMLLRKNLIWQSWNSNKAVTLKPPKTMYIFKVQNRHWIMQWSTANEKIQTKTIYHLGNSTKMFFIQPELKKKTTYLWMKNWKLLITKEITCWTKKWNWYQRANTKISTYFPSMTQKTDVGCIVRNHCT